MVGVFPGVLPAHLLSVFGVDEREPNLLDVGPTIVVVRLAKDDLHGVSPFVDKSFGKVL